MTPSRAATLRAIKQSMAHWRRVWEGKDRGITPRCCALCRVFRGKPFCDPCPLYRANLVCYWDGENPWGKAARVLDANRSLRYTPEAADMWTVLALIYEAEASDG